MDQQEPRENFVRNLHSFCEDVDLNEALIEAIKEHSNAKYMEEVMKFEDDMAKKAFIFLEFTKERDSCNEMIEILEKCDQTSAANSLKEFNSSPPFMPESKEIELNVKTATVLKMGNSKIFAMNKRPRGICVIINNVTQVLEKESLRFKSVFSQLLFDVVLFSNLTASQMVSELEKIREIAKESLIVMIISHGHDERVIGFDGNDLRITEIVDIFSEKNCKSLSRKPKLFFFNCCRLKNEEIEVKAKSLTKKNKIIIELDTVGQNWINENKCTFICFACAEGDESFYSDGYTYFGQALSHCIAQYACDRNLVSIMTLTCERMNRKLTNDSNETERTGSPEIRLCEMRRELYFNPGLPKAN